jgi:hypothetical protein
VIAPIPTSSPATGTGVVIAAGYIFPVSKMDKVSPPSVLGAAGLFTLFSKYWSLSENQVLAYNAHFCEPGGRPPFYGNCTYGTSNELRGYVAGRYFDRYMVATQLEYRLALPWRFGVVGFGGVGEAIPGGDQLLFRNNNFLPSGGGGLRFLLSKEYHVNLRADIAQGTDGHRFRWGLVRRFTRPQSVAATAACGMPVSSDSCRNVTLDL